MKLESNSFPKYAITPEILENIKKLIKMDVIPYLEDLGADKLVYCVGTNPMTLKKEVNGFILLFDEDKYWLWNDEGWFSPEDSDIFFDSKEEAEKELKKEEKPKPVILNPGKTKTTWSIVYEHYDIYGKRNDVLVWSFLNESSACMKFIDVWKLIKDMDYAKDLEYDDEKLEISYSVNGSIHTYTLVNSTVVND